MPARFGDSTPSKYYFSDSAVPRLYFGDALIWTSFTPQLITYSTPGTYTFVAPAGSGYKLDRVALGAGRAGRTYGFGVNANGGKAGSFSWDTLIEGVDFTAGDLITVVVGSGGASNGAVGTASTVTAGVKVLTGAAGLTDAYLSGYNGQTVNTGNANAGKDVLLNGQLYEGGSGGNGSGSNDPAGPPVVPGGGGWGSNASGVSGRPGGNGRVWLYTHL